MALHLLLAWVVSAHLMAEPQSQPERVTLVAIDKVTRDDPPPPLPHLIHPAIPQTHLPTVPVPVVETPPAPHAVTLPPTLPHATRLPPGPLTRPVPSVLSVSRPPPDFLSRLFARINAFKRYPYAALAARMQGRPVVHFVMDRQGKVLSCVIVKSSGTPILDQAAVAAVTDAQPLPHLPPEITGETYAITVGINFNLNR